MPAVLAVMPALLQHLPALASQAGSQLGNLGSISLRRKQEQEKGAKYCERSKLRGRAKYARALDKAGTLLS